MELISRQYTVEDEITREILLGKRKRMIDWFIEELNVLIAKENVDEVETTLEDLFLEQIGTQRTTIWMNRIKNNETSLESFKKLYMLMADYGFRPYHT